MADSVSSPLKSKSKYSVPSLQGEECLYLDLSGIEKKLPEEHLHQVLQSQRQGELGASHRLYIDGSPLSFGFHHRDGNWFHAINQPTSVK